MNKKLYIITLLVQVMLFSQNIDKTSNHNDTIDNFLKKKELKIDSLKKIDFMNMEYKFLDSDFNIKIKKNEFEKLINGYKAEGKAVMEIIITEENKHLNPSDLDKNGE